jgi:hypothetical protein
MDIRDIDMQKVFGIPATSFIGMEKFYTRAEHAEHPVFRKDHAWFLANPKQQRVLRPAIADEFCHADAFFDCLGTRIDAPRLWVMAHWRYGGHHVLVEPVYRGSCFWDIDADGYMLPFAEHDDEGNTIADGLRYRMHQQDGYNRIEQQQYFAQITEVLCKLATVMNDRVH